MQSGTVNGIIAITALAVQCGCVQFARMHVETPGHFATTTCRVQRCRRNWTLRADRVYHGSMDTTRWTFNLCKGFAVILGFFAVACAPALPDLPEGAVLLLASPTP